jgi:hypothetical protein
MSACHDILRFVFSTHEAAVPLAARVDRAQQPADLAHRSGAARHEIGAPRASGKTTPPLGATAGSCLRCLGTRRRCPSCVQRRRYAWSLVTQRGETFETAGRILNLAPDRVRQLVAEESDRQELESFRCDSIPVQFTRAAVTDALARDPDLTIGEIAHWLDMRQADFERAFLGKAKGGRSKRRVTVSTASRLMIALGRAPNELPGC